MDVAAEPERVEAFLRKLLPFARACVDAAADAGADGVGIADDWGMQHSPFISPEAFRALFKPAYKAVADAAHNRGMDFILHSCGHVLPLVDDMVEAGVDCFQFDQPEGTGVAVWAGYAARGKASFYCPTDIQKVMATGDRALIEASAAAMADAFTRVGGGLIVKDYPTWQDIRVQDEWAGWARDVMVGRSRVGQ